MTDCARRRPGSPPEDAGSIPASSTYGPPATPPARPRRAPHDDPVVRGPFTSVSQPSAAQASPTTGP